VGCGCDDCGSLVCGDACANSGAVRKNANAIALSPRNILFMLKNIIGCLQAETENIRSVRRGQGKKFREASVPTLDFTAATKQHGRVQKGEP
jgi:hypothetical protein